MTAEPWTFGEAPLEEACRIATVVRTLISTVLSLELPCDEVRALADELAVAEQELSLLMPPDLTPRVGPASTHDQRVYVDHSRDIGDFNPCFPVYSFRSADDRGEGTVEFPILYEGPPGIVHGGFLALFFDCVLQQLNCDLGLSGKTSDLSVRYRRPTPLLTRLDVHARREIGDSRILSVAELQLDGKVLCEAEMRAVVGDRAPAPRRVAETNGMSHDTVGGILRDRVRRFGAADYVVCDDERLTYEAAEVRSRRLARGLLAAGVGRSSRVAILFPTGLSFVVSWLAITRIGAIAVPISTFSTPDELRSLLASSDAGMLLAVGAYRGHDYVGDLDTALGGVDFSSPARPASSHAPNLRRVHFEVPPGSVHDVHTIESLCEEGASLPGCCPDAVEADVRPDDRMIIVYTSGSTSAPKGVIHQHGPLLQHVDNLNRMRGLTAGGRLFSNSPLFWIGGIGYNVIGTLVAGATLLCSTAANPADTLDFIERERPELVNGFAQSIAHLTGDPSFPARDFSSIRSGNLYPLLPDHLRPADLELRHNMLGMTEAGSVCLMSSDERDQPERFRGSFGQPVPGVQAQVVDPDTLEEVAPGALGELWLRGAFLMEGYYGQERADVFTPDQWYRTGDIFATDDDGFYYFKGRRGDMIKTAGANVSPREVESVLRDATGGLTAIVCGLPDSRRDQIVAAVIVAPDDVDLDLELVQQSLRSRLSAYKVPRKLVRLAPEAVPMLSSGKPDMRRLAEVFDGT